MWNIILSEKDKLIKNHARTFKEKNISHFGWITLAIYAHKLHPWSWRITVSYNPGDFHLKEDQLKI